MSGRKSLFGALGVLSIGCGLALAGELNRANHEGHMFNFPGLDAPIYSIAAVLVIGGIWAVVRAIGSVGPKD